MKNGTLRFIPLQADLCLNKQKVDIEDFKGWQKCNAPVYGGCLSPLYKANNTHHDFYIGDDYYDFASGVLSKNGTEVLSGAGTKKLKKTKTNLDVNAMAVAESGKLTWLKETGGNTIRICLNEDAEQDVTLNYAQRIISTKAFANDIFALYGIAVLYLHQNGAYGYLIMWKDGENLYTSYGEDGVTTWNDFTITSPLIQVGIMDAHKFMVSFFSSSGANLAESDVRNVFADTGETYDNPTMTDVEIYPTRYHVINNQFGIYVDVASYYAAGQEFAVVSGYQVRFVKQVIHVYLTKALTFPVTVAFFYKDATDTKYTRRTITIPAGETGAEDTVVAGACYFDPLIGTNRWSYYYNRNQTLYTPSTLPGDFFVFPCYITKEGKSSFGYTVSYSSDANPDSPTTPQNLVTVTEDCNLTVEKLASGSYMGSGLSFSSYTMPFNNNLIKGSYETNWDIDKFLFLIYGNQNWGFAKNLLSIFNGKSDNMVSMNPNTSSAKWNISAFTCSGKTLRPQIVDNNRNAICLSGSMWNMSQYTKTQYISEDDVLKQVDCCMDDGRFYSVKPMYNTEDTPLPTKIVALAGEFTSFDTATKTITYHSAATFDIAYDAEESTNVFPKYFCGQDISVSNNMFRGIYKFKAKKTDTNYIYIMIDSLGIAEGELAAHLYPGIKKGTSANIQGGVKNTTATEGWRFLFNNNLISNIGCYEKKEYIGTILCDWFTIDTDFCPAYNTQVMYYKDTLGAIWKIEMVTTGHEWEYKVVEDRYVVLNTTNYFNCYDTKTGLKRHWASDYNNRIIYGMGFVTYTNNATFKAALQRERFSGFLITGQNANYEETQDTITGLELGAVHYVECLKDDMAFISCGTPYGAVEGIDYYRGDNGSTSAIYITSFSNGMKYIDNDLVNPNAVYPISDTGDIRFNPNLFTQFVRSYNNKDMVISDGIAYKLLYYNNVIPVMAYFMLDGVEELTGAFVLQTSYYGVSETRLYQMNYSNGVGVEVVADITGLEYLGALPSQALFWSAQNKAIYSFKGNCIMQLMQYANELTGIFGKWYNPATQELFLDTNIGILVFSDLGTYCLEWNTETSGRSVSDIFFFKDRFLVNIIGDTTYTYYYSYNPLENYESNNIKIITKYYGNGLVPITVNNIYVRLYNQGVQNAEGSITFKGHTITDIGSHTDTKTIAIGGVDNPEATPPTVAGEQWDSETDTMLVKYTPQYNRGLAFALELETTFPIIDIKFDYVENGTIESQIAHINI